MATVKVKTCGDCPAGAWSDARRESLGICELMAPKPGACDQLNDWNARPEWCPLPVTLEVEDE